MKKAYTILALVLVLLVILLLFFVDATVGFLVFTAVIVGFCFLYKKQPWIITQFKRRNKNGEESVVRSYGVSSDEENKFRPRLLLINNNSLRPEQIPVDSANYVIGRNPGCNYVINGNSKISREHARIIYDERTNNSYIIDDKSKFGTYLNGEKLPIGSRKPLHNGDIIRIEDVTFSVQTKNF